MTITWQDFQSGATQLAVLITITGLIYRLLRLFFPDVPEAVMQFIAAILSSASTLVTTYSPEMPYHQWLTLGIASGLLMSQNVIKSIDWIATAATKTGAPDIGIAEKPPEWYVDLHPELFPKTTAKSDADAGKESASVAETRAQILAEQRADAQAKFPATPARTPVTPLRVPEPPPVVAPAVPELTRVPRERDLQGGPP